MSKGGEGKGRNDRKHTMNEKKRRSRCDIIRRTGVRELSLDKSCPPVDIAVEKKGY